MRIAIVSDIHGNRTAFAAVLADLRYISPDLILHGGDLADSGSGPVEIVDQIRTLGWQGVLGNTDEIHTRPESLDEFVSQSAAPASLWTAVREMAAATRDRLGEERIAWMRALPRIQLRDSIALVHASPESLWRSPTPESSEAELERTYAALARQVVVFGHIHRPFVRRIRTASYELTVGNAGSVGLSYDGDRRATYLLIDGGNVTIRRVEYDVEKEVEHLSSCGLPRSDWIARILRTGRPQMP